MHTCTTASWARSRGTSGRMLNGGHSSPSPAAAGSCYPAKEPPRVPEPGCQAVRPGAVCGTALGDRVSWELICHVTLP